MRQFVKIVLPVILLATACIGLPQPRGSGSTGVQVGPVHRVSPSHYVFEPSIAVDPRNPNHLAAIVTSADAFDCDSLNGNCAPILMLDVSQDDATWTEYRLTKGASGDGTVAIAPDGTIYEAGIHNFDRPGVAFSHQGLPEDDVLSVDYEPHFPGVGADKPWMSIDQRTGAIYVAYTAPHPEQPNRYSLLLERSSDGGKTWNASVVPPGYGGQVLPGPGGQLAIAFLTTVGIAEADLLLGERIVAVSTSPDGGKTFSAASTIGKSLGFESATARAGVYYVAYLSGTQQAEQLTVATPRDSARTWQSSVANGPIPLYYAPAAPAPAPAMDIEAYRREVPHWLDPCAYNVHYTFSKDGGKGWTAPRQLNEQPIEGRKAVQIPSGRSRLGEYVGMASTERYAYPLWIDTQGTDGTQANTVRIER